MLYILYLYILSYAYITYSSSPTNERRVLVRYPNSEFILSNELYDAQWYDSNASFITEQDKARENFIHANRIVQTLRQTCNDIHDQSNLNNTTDSSIVIESQKLIEKLYKLAELSNSEIRDENEYIEDTYNVTISKATQKVSTLRPIPSVCCPIFLTVAEDLHTKIFYKARTWGLYPNRFPTNREIEEDAKTIE